MKRDAKAGRRGDQLLGSGVALKIWRRLLLPKIKDNDNHVGLNQLYAMNDPWQMSSAKEQARFIQTNDVILRKFGRVGSILEIGCGEGHQSEHLSKLCDRLDGVDVSQRAIGRAKERVPTGRFGVGDIHTLPWSLEPGETYDLVVACEVLYYVSDIKKTLDGMSRIGRGCLVTFFAPSARRVAMHVDSISGAEKGWIHHDPETWLWALWRASDTRELQQ